MAEHPFFIPENSVRLLLLLEYLGTPYCGNVAQPQAITVQSEIEKVLSTLEIPIQSAIHFSGRTDSGVHAKATWMQVTVPKETQLRFPYLQKSLNALLPNTIAIREIAWCEDENFHVTISAKYRWYRYRIQNQAYRSVDCPENAIWLSRKLDLNAMNQAAQYLLGPQDFSSFQCESGQDKHANCNIIFAQWSVENAENNILAFDIIANRYVYKMVRSIVGTLLEVGKGELEPKEMQRIIKAKNRSQACQTAPSQGLTLITADYGPNCPFFQNDVYVSMISTQVKRLTLVEVL